MAAITTPQDRPQMGVSYEPSEMVFAMKAATKIVAGAAVVLNAGYADNATPATGLVSAGLAIETVDNSAGANGDLKIRVQRGVFPFTNSAAADEITVTELLTEVYWVDNDTVAKTNGSSTRSVAGKVMAIDSDGVWVQVG